MRMTDPEKLTDLLRRWEELTAAEYEAIAAEAWARLNTVQKAKDCLQDEIGNVHDRLLSVDPGAECPEWNKLVAQLIECEKRNRDELERRRDRVSAARRSLQRTGQRLSLLQQAYSPGVAREWSTYT